MGRKLRTLTAFVLCVLVGGTILTGCGIRYIASNNYLRKDDGIKFTVEKSIVDSINEIKITTRMAQVEVIPADQFYVEIDYMYWDEEPEYTLENGVLYFNDADCFPNSYSINFNLDNKIKIYLPEATSLERVWVENSSGDVDLSSFVSKDLDLTISYGDLSIKEAAASNADITLSSGTSKVSDFQVGDLDFTNSYGNAKFTNINVGDNLLPEDTTFDQFVISMSSGDVQLNGLNCNSLDITDSYGNVTLEDVTAKEGEFDLSSGNLEVTKSLIKEIDSNNSYGNVTLSLLTAPSDYNLDLSTSYGNIKVGNKSYEDNARIDNNVENNIVANLSSGDVTIRFED